jgi:hypothetical protein
MPQGGAGNGRGPGGAGPGGRPGFLGAGLAAAAKAIGITPQQLMTEIRGKTLTDVAQAHGKAPTDVANALKTAANQRIDAAVAAGRLTADQGNTQKSQVDQRIDQFMTQVVPQRGNGGPPPAGTDNSGAEDQAATN